LWISLEILRDLSGTSVEGHYRAKCGHEITTCPDCGKSTSREVRGPTIQQYLVSEYDVDPNTSKRLWVMRQMMHGAINFDSAKLADLPGLVEELRASVVVGIKRRINVPENAPPIISAKRGRFRFPSIGAAVAKEVTDHDIQPLIASEVNPPATT
jgi:hypothetical protein